MMMLVSLPTPTAAHFGGQPSQKSEMRGPSSLTGRALNRLQKERYTLLCEDV